MNELFKGSTPQSKILLKNSQLLNTHLSFASITMNEGTNKSVRNNPDPYFNPNPDSNTLALTLRAGEAKGTIELIDGTK